MKKFLEYIVDLQRQTALLNNISSPHFPTNSNFIESQPAKVNLPSSSEVFAPAGVLSQLFEGYEERPGQAQMAKAIEESFTGQNLLLVEAGTGVGKSLAYLIPALRFAYINSQRIIVSTNTKNLQEQLFNKDIPTVRDCLQIPFTAVLLKGRDNYLCLKKWQQVIFDTSTTLNTREKEALLGLVVWQHFTASGDITENHSFARGRSGSLWKKIGAERHQCSGKKCHNFSNCFLMTIRKKSEKASLVVVNHSLLLSDSMNENNTLGEYKHLIIDEAHNLADNASAHLGISLSYADINSFTSLLYNVGRAFEGGFIITLKSACAKSLITDSDRTYLNSRIDLIADYIKKHKENIENVFFRTRDVVRARGSYQKFRIKEIQEISSLSTDLKTLQVFVNDISNHLLMLLEYLSGINSSVFKDHENNMHNLEAGVAHAQELSHSLGQLLEPDFDKVAYWLSSINTDKDDYPAGVLNLAPLEVGEILQKALYDACDSIIFTSATISLRGRFKYYKSRVGLLDFTGKALREMIVDSPFNYPQQAMVLAASFLPAPADDYFLAQAAEIIRQLIIKNRVGTLILFTSYKNLNEVYEIISEDLYRHNINLLAQGKGMSRSAMVEEFKKDTSSVLLGTSSFWEGVDLPGDALSLLVLYKLPFQVPSEPIVEAFLEKLEKQGKKSFMHYMMPNALLKYRQGFGRLIRSSSDTGVVLTLDNRIATKQYGKYFQEILPLRTSFPQSPLEIYDSIARWFSKSKNHIDKEK